jgi:hypothetical protein
MIRTNAIANVRQQIHSDLRIQHPEWFLPNGESPICDAYEARLMDLLALVSSPPTSEGILGTASGRCADCAVPMGALIAAFMALYGAAHQQAHAMKTHRNNGSDKSDHQGGRMGELVLLGLDGTVFAREVNLGPQGSLTRY